MIGKISNTHRKEYPVSKMWYTKDAGKTIEEIIETDLSFFEWMVKTFLFVTPSQAEYYHNKTGYKIPKEYIRNVEPYVWMKGDPMKLYIELCDTFDLENTIKKYRHTQLELF